MIKDLKRELLNYKIVGELLSDMKEEFSGGNDEMMKVAESKKVEQRSKTMKEFVQEFRRTAERSRYKERPLVEEFKRDMNGVIRQKLIESECLPRSIE